jgi:hypothetical protein
MTDERSSLTGGALNAFDYGALNDPKTEQTARQAAAFIRETHLKTIGGILEIGARLIAIKRLMPGQFLGWLEVECWFKRSTAENYMAAARYAQQRLARIPMIGSLEPSALYRIAHYSTSKKSWPLAITRLEEALQSGPLDLAEVNLIIEQEERELAAKAERFERSLPPVSPPEPIVFETEITQNPSQPETYYYRVTAPSPESANPVATTAPNSQPLGIAADARAASEPASRSAALQAPEPPALDRVGIASAALADCPVEDWRTVVTGSLAARPFEEALHAVSDWHAKLTPEEHRTTRELLYPAIQRPRG